MEKNRKNVRIVEMAVMIALLFAVVIIFSILQKGKTEPTQPQETSQPVFSEANDIETENKAAENEIIEHITPYYEKNSDTVGYIKIDDTQVNYPVVYRGDNQFYMERNFEQQPAEEGAIFMDYRCDFQDFSHTRNIILYGHRMKDGSMFKELTKYADRSFYESHRTFRFDTLYKEYECEVFAVFKTNTDFYYINTDFNSDEEWVNFMQECYNRSLYQDKKDKFYPTDMVLTLSTCAINKNERFVVMAKLKH